MAEDREDATSGGKHPRSGPTYDALGFLYLPASVPSLSPQSQFLSSSYIPAQAVRGALPICTKLTLYPGVPRAGGGGRLGTGLVRSLLDAAR